MTSEEVYRTITVAPTLTNGVRNGGRLMSASTIELGDQRMLEIRVDISENHRIKKVRRIYVNLYDEPVITLDTVENYIEKGLI